MNNSYNSFVAQFLKNAVLILASIFVSLAICEITLRVMHFSAPLFYKPDPEVGAVLRPGAAGLQKMEGETYITINSQGLRDYEHSSVKSENSIRIAVLGDSYAEALQVPIDKTFWSIAKDTFDNQCPSNQKKLEPINLGVSGYGTAQEFIRLRRDAWQYNPDIVLLAVTVGNDIRNNSKELEPDKARPFLNKDNTFDFSYIHSHMNTSGYKLKNSWIGRMATEASNHLRIIQLVYYSIDLYLYRNALSLTSKSTSEVGIDDFIYHPPQTDAEKEAWNTTERLLLMMKKEVEGKGKKLLVVTLSSGIQVSLDRVKYEQFKQSFERQYKTPFEPFYPDYRIKAFLEKNNINYLILAPQLQRTAVEKNIYMHGFGNNLGGGHWNENGHRYAGEIIANKLCGMLSQ